MLLFINDSDTWEPGIPGVSKFRVFIKKAKIVKDLLSRIKCDFTRSKVSKYRLLVPYMGEKNGEIKVGSSEVLIKYSK